MRRFGLLIVWLCFAITLFCVAYPIYVIRPFRHQGAIELAAALRVIEWRSTVSDFCETCSVAALFLYWRGQMKPWRRMGISMLAALTFILGALTHVNVYEKMFHPIDAPAFDPVASVSLDAAEKVLAVRLSGNARAYPVRAIAYHHIVNDSVGGVPLVATY